MYYLALVNETTGELVINPKIAPVFDGCEEWADESEANSRFEALGLQAEINNLGRNPEVKKGDRWTVYMGDTPYKIMPKPTKDELIAELAASVRARRDALLIQSDWTKNPERPLAPEVESAWKAYRDALFDIPEQVGFPETVVWPEAPNA